jgi:hypothetical protein
LKRKRAAVPGTAALRGCCFTTPGQAERKVGRSSKLWNLPVAYHFTVNERTIKGALRSSFFPLSSFLFFFIGFAVGFMPSSPRSGLALRRYLLQSPRQRLAPIARDENKTLKTISVHGPQPIPVFQVEFRSPMLTYSMSN